jgi:hypothetical protein
MRLHVHGREIVSNPAGARCPSPSFCDWATPGKTALSALVGAGVGSALVQGLFSLMEKRRRQAAYATYLAMRVAVVLDAFGLACSSLILRNAMAEHPQEHQAGTQKSSCDCMSVAPGAPNRSRPFSDGRKSVTRIPRSNKAETHSVRLPPGSVS